MGAKTKKTTGAKGNSEEDRRRRCEQARPEESRPRKNRAVRRAPPEARKRAVERDGAVAGESVPAMPTAMKISFDWRASTQSVFRTVA
jgi:hypothetical protein